MLQIEVVEILLEIGWPFVIFPFTVFVKKCFLFGLFVNIFVLKRKNKRQKNKNFNKRSLVF
jgi:hypothetical protein